MGLGKFLKKALNPVKAVKASVKSAGKAIKTTVKSAGQLAKGNVKESFKTAAKGTKEAVKHAGYAASNADEKSKGGGEMESAPKPKKAKTVGKNLRTEGNKKGDAPFYMS